MKAQKSSIARCVDEPDAKIRFYLFSGQDEAQSRGLAGRLLAALGATRFALSAADVKGNPALLVDEAAALSLFGERRLVWIEPATNDIAEGVEGLLAAPSVESPVVAIAGPLSKASALLKLAESSPLALAFTAWTMDSADAARTVVEIGRRVGLKVAPPLARRIASVCGNDQAVAAQELEKLAIYMDASPHAPKALDTEAIDAVGAESAEGDVMRLADLALAGDMDALCDSIERLPAAGTEAIPAIRALQRRLQMLAPGRARIERGEKLDAVMASIGKSLFWKDKDSVQRMLQTWSAGDLATIAERAGALERSLLFAKVPEREALEKELLAIARKARSARR